MFPWCSPKEVLAAQNLHHLAEESQRKQLVVFNLSCGADIALIPGSCPLYYSLALSGPSPRHAPIDSVANDKPLRHGASYLACLDFPVV